MKIINYPIIATLLIILCQSGYTQGFMNLDFEDAIIVQDPSSPYYPYGVYVSDAIPGWSTYVGSTSQSSIVYNALSLGAPSVGIFDTNGAPSTLIGQFSIVLYGGAELSTGVSISQTGVVPTSAVSIFFLAQGSGSLGGDLLISLGGQNIPFFAISIGSNYTMYGGNIPLELAGQNEELVFYAAPGVNNYWEIDNIQFSSTSVPEPSTLALSALGGAFLVRYRRREKCSGG